MNQTLANRSLVRMRSGACQPLRIGRMVKVVSNLAVTRVVSSRGSEIVSPDLLGRYHMNNVKGG